jgi:hypothetical protein
MGSNTIEKLLRREGYGYTPRMRLSKKVLATGSPRSGLVQYLISLARALQVFTVQPEYREGKCYAVTGG